jgi:hypothetical protein
VDADRKRRPRGAHEDMRVGVVASSMVWKNSTATDQTDGRQHALRLQFIISALEQQGDAKV